MKLIRLLFALMVVSFCWSVPHASALSAYLNPESIGLNVQPGQHFSFDIFLASEAGDSYDVTLERFSVDPEQGLIYSPLEEEAPLWVDEEVFTVGDAGEGKLTVSGAFPEDMPAQDLLVAVLFERHVQAGERLNINLKSHLYIRVGDPEGMSGTLQDPFFHVDEGIIDHATVTFVPDEGLQRFFSVQGGVEFLDAHERVVAEVVSRSQRVFPPLKKQVQVYLFAEEDLMIDKRFASARFVVRDEDGELIDTEMMDPLPIVDVFTAKGEQESAYGEQLEMTIGKTFVWTEWLGHFLLIILGLSLIIYTLYPKKKV